MKELALQIGGFDIKTPTDISRFSNVPFGLNIISAVINLLLIIAIMLALGFATYGGIKWIMSEGESKQVESARTTILYSALGLGVAMFAMFLVNVLGLFFGAKLFAH